MDYKEEFKYLRQKVDDISEIQAKHTVILERNTESLVEHVRRTNLLEEQLEVALIPIKVARIVGYIIGLLGTVVGAILALRVLL